MKKHYQLSFYIHIYLSSPSEKLHILLLSSFVNKIKFKMVKLRADENSKYSVKKAERKSWGAMDSNI